MMKPGIRPAIPGLQGIGLSPTPRRLPYLGSKDLLRFLAYDKVAKKGLLST